MPGRLFLLALLFCAAAVQAQVRALGELSFAVPEGWQFEPPEPGRATMSLAQGDNVAVIGVFSPLPSSGNADNDFRNAWAQTVRSLASPEPIYEHKASAGYPGRYGSTHTPDNSHYVVLYALQAAQRVIPVLVITVHRRQFDELVVPLFQFVEGVRAAPLKAQPVKNTVVLADLVGEWRSGGDSSVNYVTSSGTYAGSSTVAHGQGTVISADGRFTYRFAGISNRQVIRQEGAGKVELADGYLAFREPAKNRLERYRMVSYQTALDGSTLLTLLPDSYEPTPGNISFYAQKWVRSAASSGPKPR